MIERFRRASAQITDDSSSSVTDPPGSNEATRNEGYSR